MQPAIGFVRFLVLFLLNFIRVDGSQYFGDVKPPKIGVIGAGIGGSVTSYRLKNIFGSELPTIDVYEYDDVGGRLRTVLIDGSEYEVGGTIIHSSNRYMKEFTQLLGLETLSDDSENFAMYRDGEKVFETSENSWLVALQMLWRYGLSLLTMTNAIQSYLTDFERIYKWQKDYQSFTSVPNLLMSMSDKLMNSTTVSLRDDLRSIGVSDRLIDELCTVASRVNYGQTVDNLNSFVGHVALCGTTGSLWAVKGGNKQVAKGLLDKAGVKLITSRVEKVVNISTNNTKPRYRLTTVDGASTEYDILVLAAPLTSNAEPVVQFEGFTSNLDKFYREYHRTLAYIIKGVRNYKYFGYENEESMPSNIFSLGKSDFYSSIGTIHSVKGDNPIYKVFANQPLSDEQLDNLFLSRDSTEVIPWLAYPEYSTDIEFTPFVLAPGFYYNNAIELSASAMEMAAIGGTNMAYLVVHQWMENYHLIDNLFVIEEKHIKFEL